MLTEEQILKNKEEFINTLRSNVKRDGIEALIKKLETSDFFIAPASSIYHGSYRGGLCQHSLHVYKRLITLIEDEYPKDKDEQSTNPYSLETISIVSLLHDMSKINQYEIYTRNKKVYSESGRQYDNHGRYDWVAEEAYKVKEFKDRFTYGSHSVNSIYMITRYIATTFEEELAIMHHMGGKDFSDDSSDNGKITSEAFNKSTLAVLLHIADLQATYIDERLISE